VLAALYLVFVGVPTDSFQGPVQRIFYVHMAMWLATFTAFGLVAVASLCYLWKRQPAWDHLGRAAAELGLLFCSLGLITGSIWAKPIWGTWWTWDPRLTLTLVLWMIYAAYLLLRSLANEPQQGATLAAILGVTGVIDLYLINRAVYWWRGIHPAVIQTREGGTGLADPMMRATLVVCMLAFFLLFLWLLRLRLRTAKLQDTVEELRAELAPGLS
jgi:heme exporter protein C